MAEARSAPGNQNRPALGLRGHGHLRKRVGLVIGPAARGEVVLESAHFEALPTDVFDRPAQRRDQTFAEVGEDDVARLESGLLRLVLQPLSRQANRPVHHPVQPTTPRRRQRRGVVGAIRRAQHPGHLPGLLDDVLVGVADLGLRVRHLRKCGVRDRVVLDRSHRLQALPVGPADDRAGGEERGDRDALVGEERQQFGILVQTVVDRDEDDLVLGVDGMDHLRRSAALQPGRGGARRRLLSHGDLLHRGFLRGGSLRCASRQEHGSGQRRQEEAASHPRTVTR